MIDEKDLDIIKLCRAILLVHGEVKSSNRHWVDRQVKDILYDIHGQLDGAPPYAIIDAPPEPRLDAAVEPSVLMKDSLRFENELEDSLRLHSRAERRSNGCAP